MKGKGHCSKRNSPHCYHGKTRGVYRGAQHAAGTVVNKQVKGKILAKKINAHIENITHSKSGDNFLKCVRENYQKKKEAKAKGTNLGSTEESTGPTQRHTCREKQWRRT